MGGSRSESANFAFLRQHDERLVRLGALAERYFADDPPAALIKLRQLGELLAKDVAARHALLPSTSATFDDVLKTLRGRAILPEQVAELFYHLKRLGNAAAHQDEGSPGDALNALKIARAAAIWFHQTYGNAPGFKGGPFVPPATPADAANALRDEIEQLRATVAVSSDAEAKARLQAQDAEAARVEAASRAEERERERAFWEEYAATTESALRRVEQALAETQARATLSVPLQLDRLAAMGARQAREIELDEVTTRVLIDEQLRAVGWIVDSAALRYATGARPERGKAMAIAEWPTQSGPTDYALFVDGRCVGVVEAKRKVKDVPGHFAQAKRYARDITLATDERPARGPWKDSADLFHVPFMFATNGRPYVKQLATKSGIWFWDVRIAGVSPHPLADWLSPRDIEERLEQQPGEDVTTTGKLELGVSGLRPYQVDAIEAVEVALASGQRDILIAMATGTGKTRLAIALMFEFLGAKRFRRILFLVDRNALGQQTLDALSTTDTSSFLKFDQIFPIAGLKRKFPEATDRVQVATVQAMVARIFEDPDAKRPTPGTYDLIIIDEAHRGYTLDAELRDQDLEFRNLDDYLSAYRRVLDYFDATKIALTATPALHTREIFGDPVYRYGYRQAVIDGYLIDHRPPRRIMTALAQTGISFFIGDEVSIFNPRTGNVDLAELEDQVDFEVSEFNRKVYTRPFNRAVADAIARECPPDERGKTLLFAARDDHADILVEELRAALTDDYGPQPHDLVEKITGSVDRPLDRIKAFKNDPRPKYVVTVDLLTTGIDVPAITNLVFVRRVNSRILYDQMIGRATRRCDEIGKEYFRIFDAVDIYSALQSVSEMRPVVVNPALSFGTLLSDLEHASSDEDQAFVRDQIVVKLRQRLRRLDGPRREQLAIVLEDLDQLPDRLKVAKPEQTLLLFQQHQSLAAVLDASVKSDGCYGIYISEHEDELVSIDDDFGGKASPADYIESFESFVRENMNAIPALIAATQRPRELTRRELKEIAVLLDAHGFSEANLRRAYGRARNADIAAHIIGFIRQAAIGAPLVPYEVRVKNGVERMLASRNWTAKQKRWLERIGRALKEQPVGDRTLLSDPLFAQAGGFDVVDHEFDHRLTEVLMDLNDAIWDSHVA